ncbi:MAG: GNAT family protein [Candidatus Promineifilaceae bacterium]|nr:GNAT family N-acetyltransferase [Anaerolineaceae bacterium]
MLQNDKVRLRAIGRDDLPALARFNNDRDVELAGGGDPPWPQALERLTAEYEAKWSQGGRDGNEGSVEFAIEGNGQFIGICALFNVNQTARTCELGISIGDKTAWGQGYGRSTLTLLLQYAFTYLNMHKVWLQVHGSNQRAIRAYLACGFVEEGRQRQQVWSNGRYDDLVQMGILRSDWLQQQP